MPVREDVRGACEILGLDPLYVANEGRFVAFVARRTPRTRPSPCWAATRCRGGACASAGSTERPAGLVTLRSRIGATRIVDLLSGEQLPRIC